MRKHTTWRTRPAATAIMAAITDPAGPKVSPPPLYQVGRRPRASSRALTPPSLEASGRGAAGVGGQPVDVVEVQVRRRRPRP